MDFDKLKIAKAYTKARQLNPSAKKVWAEAILKYVNPESIQNILDLGCGTGRFIPFLRELFPKAKIIGIDPSKEMLSEAKSGIGDQLARLIEGRAEQIPLRDQSIDLVFMVMIFHTLSDRKKAAEEIKRVLKPNGIVVIKQISQETNETHNFFKFFPESLDLAKKVVNFRQDVLDTFLGSGFILQAHQVINYEVSSNYAEYFQRIQNRGISILKMLPDEIWERRLREFKKYADKYASEGPVENARDLFVFVKP